MGDAPRETDTVPYVRREGVDTGHGTDREGEEVSDLTLAQRKLWRAKEAYQRVLWARDWRMKEARALWRAQAKLGVAQRAVDDAEAALRRCEPVNAASMRGRVKRAERAVMRAREAVEAEQKSKP